MEVVPGPSELKYGAWLKASPHVRPRVFSFRTFNTNRESSDNVFQEAKNVYGEFSIDNHANSGKKSSSSEEIPAVIPVKQVLIGVQGAVCNSKVLSNPVGLESVRTENILEGDIVPFSCVGSNTILSVEDCGEVAETIAVKEVDIDKDVGKGFVQSLVRDEDFVLGNSIANGPDCGLVSLDIKPEDLMEVKVGVIDFGEAQTSLKKVSKRWKRIVRSPIQKNLARKGRGRWLVSKVNSLAYELFCSLIWSVWNDRNLLVHSKKVRSAEEIVSSASFLLQDFQHSMDSLAAVPLVKFVALAVSRWEAPPPGSLKLNCDAAVKVDSPCVGLGAVIRNSSGQVVLASCKV
ncbi:hypothetical protein ACOSP7_005130 [Xanthoceras sorbifolium]